MTKIGFGEEDAILALCIPIYLIGFVLAFCHLYLNSRSRDTLWWVPGAFRRDICLMPLCPIVFLLPIVLWPIWYLPLVIWWAVRGLWEQVDTCCGINLSGFGGGINLSRIKNGINLSRFKKKKQDGTELRDMASNDGIGVRGTDNDAAHVQGQAYGKYIHEPPPVYTP
ncbi:hypothetical protein QBC46DRAFT_340553 [Diplogelasinospora grovesii]|uniref:Uncharacterized protein n=1 Tax=Diplogelasinospora grovesii TaxID=303347 RepID=A0AAN6S689_9PEZI|nr:hypothetical protein QBC46DRAFT_340553 [Diplogelasinospora grovesii]